jgi:hypothetical protein
VEVVKVFESFTNRTLMGLLLVLMFGGFIVAVWWADRSKDEFKIVDVLMENGKASKWAVILFCSWIVHTWVIVAWVMNQAATLADLTVYGTTWVAPLIAKMFVQPKGGPDENP